MNKSFLVLLNVFLLANLHYCKTEYICTSPIPKFLEINIPQRPLPKTSRIVNVGLRILLHYTDEFEKLEHSGEMKTALINRAVQYWSGALRAVDARDKPFVVSKQCDGSNYRIVEGNGNHGGGYCNSDCVQKSTCGGVDIPSMYLQCKKMVDDSPKIVRDRNVNKDVGDILLLVDHRHSEHCREGTLVYAETCVVNAEHNRPIVGIINFCQDFGNFQYPQQTIAYQAVRHQLGHALGFNAAMFDFMRDEHGNPRTPRDQSGFPSAGKDTDENDDASKKPVVEGHLQWESEAGTYYRYIMLLRTPTVLKEAREHFHCDDLEGVELEDFGVKNNHFKKRVVMDELMSGVVTVDSKVSSLTLGYFADSGWYHVDFTKVENWNWGRYQGCGFVQHSCYEYISRQHTKHTTYRLWCTELDSTDTECLLDSSAFGNCNLMKHSSPLESRFQYFQNPNYGGRDGYTDYCPYIQISENDCDTPTTICKHKDNGLFVDENRAAQHFGPNSICLNHDSSQSWKYISRDVNRTYSRKMATCHEYKCSPNEGLKIVINGEEIQCEDEPATVEFDTEDYEWRLLGRFVCPGCSSVCKDQCPP